MIRSRVLCLRSVPGRLAVDEEPSSDVNNKLVGALTQFIEKKLR